VPLSLPLSLLLYPLRSHRVLLERQLAELAEQQVLLLEVQEAEREVGQLCLYSHFRSCRRLRAARR
jgi:hypothetical protein